MARSRNIKPGFYKNENLAELDPFDRLLYPGLWMLADREGRLEYRPKKIKMELFPLDNYDVAGGIDNLVKAGFLKVYEVGDYKVIRVISFHEHQNPHGTEKDSKLPCINGYLTVNERSKNNYITGKVTLVSIFPENEAAEIDQNDEQANSLETVEKPIDNSDLTDSAPTDNSNITDEEQEDNSSLTVNSQLPNTLIPESLILNPLTPKGGDDSPDVEEAPPNIWAVGVPMLTSQGNSETSARGFIAVLIKKHGEEKTAAAFAVASVKQPAELRSWLSKYLDAETKSKPSDSLHTKFDQNDYKFKVAADGSF